MVVQGILALALALPTGLLFGVGYGTGVRVGYEQVYPLLFPQDSSNRNVAPTVDNIKRINNIYNTIGGKEASQMGIANGLAGAMEEINKNPDFQALEALELRLSGRTQSRLGQDAQSKPTSISDFPSGSSADPNNKNYNREYHAFILSEQGKSIDTIENMKLAQNAPFPSGFDFGNRSQLNAEAEIRAQIEINKFTPRDPRKVIEGKEWNAWNQKKIDLLNNIIRAKSNMARQTNPFQKKIWNNRIFDMRKQLRIMSLEYRHPNRLIGKAALQLKAELARGLYK